MVKRQAVSSHVMAGYCAYLVRLWQEAPNKGWRASAQSAQSGETVRFADLAQLFAFLQAQATTQPPADELLPPAADKESTTGAE
ncbi:MAG: hypothetical protein DYG89_46095 [Caldilinea sp. CFX5]|nr:hypothetical protein [Caldilinea sp. CFX5]